TVPSKVSLPSKEEPRPKRAFISPPTAEAFESDPPGVEAITGRPAPGSSFFNITSLRRSRWRQGAKEARSYGREDARLGRWLSRAHAPRARRETMGGPPPPTAHPASGSAGNPLPPAPPARARRP